MLTQAGNLSYSRDPATGLLTGTALGALTTSHAHNTFGELDNEDASAGATALYQVQYDRDALGRITRKTETIAGITDVYDYRYDLAGEPAARFHTDLPRQEKYSQKAYSYAQYIPPTSKNSPRFNFHPSKSYR